LRDSCRVGCIEIAGGDAKQFCAERMGRRKDILWLISGAHSSLMDNVDFAFVAAIFGC
jgi:hypothetical protein